MRVKAVARIRVSPAQLCRPATDRAAAEVRARATARRRVADPSMDQTSETKA